MAANITNTVALTPGYLGATIAQINDLRRQGARMWVFMPASILGGITGGILLLQAGEQVFRPLVPFLILFGTLLIAIQHTLQTWLSCGSHKRKSTHAMWPVLLIFPSAVYGGYFGAGGSVIILAILVFVLHDTLPRLNALKQAIACSVNCAAAVFFIFSGQVVWSAASVIAVGALAGGLLGGALAGWIQEIVLRRIIVAFGIGVSLLYFLN